MKILKQFGESFLHVMGFVILCFAGYTTYLLGVKIGWLDILAGAGILGGLIIAYGLGIYLMLIDYQKMFTKKEKTK